MILQYGHEGFKEEWLELIKNDPVHPNISIQKRLSGDRTVFVYLHDSVPQFMVCVRIGNRLPRNMMEVLNDDGYKSKYDITYAIFYSIFPGVNRVGKPFFYRSAASCTGTYGTGRHGRGSKNHEFYLVSQLTF